MESGNNKNYVSKTQIFNFSNSDYDVRILTLIKVDVPVLRFLRIRIKRKGPSHTPYGLPEFIKKMLEDKNDFKRGRKGNMLGLLEGVVPD